MSRSITIVHIDKSIHLPEQLPGAIIDGDITVGQLSMDCTRGHSSVRTHPVLS